MVVANVRSLTNKFDELHAFVEEVKPAVVGITESWLNDDYSDAGFTIPGYVMYRQDRMDTHRGFGGGVLLYVKGELNSIEREDLQGNFTNSVWCEIQMGRKKNSPLIIGVVYRKRQHKSQRPPWMSEDLFREIRKKRKLWHRYKLSSSNDDLTAFNDQVRLVRQQILSAKVVFERSLASNIKENPKAFFRYVRSK